MIDFGRSQDIPKDTKIGYAGTLDVLAEGLLVVGIGRAYTKQLSQMSDADKVYETIINLSGWTKSGDLEQPIQTVGINIEEPDYSRVLDVLEEMTSTQMQIPSIFSAKKVDGQRSYVSARTGNAVELRPCKITIYSIELLDYQFPKMEIRVTCTKGTFIRTLVMEIGKKLTGGAYVEKLVRTKVGDYVL